MNQPAQRHHRYSLADYLACEDGSNVKHEFFAGEIYAMAGGTPLHAALSAAATTLLGGQIAAGECRVFSSDLKIRVLATGLVSYPDVTVVCGPLQYDAESRLVVVSPSLIVEVLSDSTEDWDRGEKLEHYQKIPSLRECLLISHRMPSVELWRREPDGRWTRQVFGAGDSIALTSIDGTLPVDELYRRGMGAPVEG